MTALDETVTVRPRKTRKVAIGAAVFVVIVFTAIAFALRGKTESGKSVFRVEDQIAMVVLGLLGAAGILMFIRPTLVADRNGLRFRNLLGWIDLPWEVVEAVRFDYGSPWVSLDLRDDDVIAVMAVQAADKEYAVSAVRSLRALLAASRDREPRSL